ncbi:TPA: hypothetical protein KQC97_003555 [Clostridioides difficile]|uniref:DnaB-like helicase C-terminal domain-containing protein n=1 Tax=Clostridioides difficile TaxID=1496 RepID=UPI001592983F|nr:DnaB-like helicase C-terminal domain-containing protein [Clostridioides difficile]EKJ1397939.1 hypothetical protein [Clostridioides difficile]MCI9997216.1 hypothetical protein [Clostridioides difficile]MDW0091997.1 hypothetical protein [Clostridioides difficile]HBF5454836.1 hypothetical protein [Clostridioides difficile]HBF6471725.1 hypothetical protein [Clostridioides difficile]
MMKLKKVSILGIKFLDETIGSLYSGELITVTAKSGRGKTALALQIMRNVVFQVF